MMQNQFLLVTNCFMRLQWLQSFCENLFVLIYISLVLYIKPFLEDNSFNCFFSLQYSVTLIYPNFQISAEKKSSFDYLTFSRHRWIKVQSQLAVKNHTPSLSTDKTISENQVFFLPKWCNILQHHTIGVC